MFKVILLIAIPAALLAIAYIIEKIDEYHND